MQEQQKLNEQLRDTVVSQLKAFNLVGAIKWYSAIR